MNCDKYLELLALRLDGALSEAEERELEEHLAACPKCRAAGAQLAALQGAFGEWEDIPAPEGFAQGVMDRIQAEEPQKVIPLFKRPRFRALAGLAACLVLAVGLYSAAQPRRLDGEGLMVQSFNRGAIDENAAACEVLDDPDAPQIASYAAPEDNPGMQKAAPNLARDGLEDDSPLVEGMTTLERMPDGAAELIPPETVVMPADNRRGSIYLDLPLEVLDQIERLAQEQGIGVTAERCSAPEAEVQYNLEILQPND